MVFITDKEKARTFYGEVLGLVLLSEDDKRLVYDMGGHELVLFETLRPTSLGAYSEEARTVLVFHVDDVEKAFHELAARGVRFLHSRPTSQKYAAFVDPFGNVHEILQTSGGID